MRGVFSSRIYVADLHRDPVSAYFEKRGVTNSPSWKQYSGHIPTSLSNASHLKAIQLHFNMFSGTIPPNLRSLQNLEWISFDNNLLEAKGSSHGWSFLNNLTNCSNLLYPQLQSNDLGGVMQTPLQTFPPSFSY